MRGVGCGARGGIGAPLRVVHQAIEDAVCNRRISDLRVPVVDLQLAGQQRGVRLISGVPNLQEVSSFGIGKRRHRPVIHHDHIDTAEPVQQLAMTAVGSGDRQIAE